MTKARDMSKQLKKSVVDSILTQEVLASLTEFGRRLRILRKSADMTQSELAEKMCVTGSAINKYESSSNVFPSIEVLLKLAIFFNVSTDFLLLGTKHSSNVGNNVSGEINNSSVVQANQGSVVSSHGKKISPKADVLLEVYEGLSDGAKYELLTTALLKQAEERKKKSENVA